MVYERIYHEAGAHTDMHLPYLELVRLIRGAGKRPVERDSLYQSVRDEFDDPPPEPSRPARRGAAGGARRMRLGRIPWINCYPVYGAIDRGLVRVPAELVTRHRVRAERPARRGRAAGERRLGRRVRAERRRVPPAARSRHHLRRAGAQRRALLPAPGRRARRAHGAPHRIVPHVGAAARAALPPPLGRARPASPPPAPRRPISTRSTGCRTRRCW